MSILKLPADFRAENRLHVSTLHKALTSIKLPIDDKAVAGRLIDGSTTAAVKKLQEEFRLEANGDINHETVTALNDKLHDQFVSSNKYRTAQLHSLLNKLKISLDDADKAERKFGNGTRKAIELFQQENGLPVNGKLSETVLRKMQDKLIRDQFYSGSRTQRGRLLETLQKINKIAGLNRSFDAGELHRKELGMSSGEFVKAFQQRYRLPVTGEIDSVTYEKIKSVAASKGSFAKKISAPPVSQLKVVSKELRLNMVSPSVSELQKNLAFLGYRISETEFKMNRFGKTTTQAITAFQKQHNLPVSGQYDRSTMKLISSRVAGANPAASGEHRYRIRGSVRDEYWKPQKNMVIKVYELVLDQETPEPIAAKKIFLKGFFDIAYDAPVDAATGKIKERFHAVVKLYSADDQSTPIAVQTHYNIKQIHWVNFTAGRDSSGQLHYNATYLGESRFSITHEILKKAVHDRSFTTIKETPADRQVTQLSIQTGLHTDDIMRHVLAARAAVSVAVPELNAEVFYLFIAQHLPAGLPGDLLRGSSDWETIDHLVELLCTGVAFLENELQRQVIDNAVRQNLISQEVKINTESILQALEQIRIGFTLDKPILTGNNNLRTLLGSSLINDADYPVIAAAFVKNKGINTGFWNDVNSVQLQLGADKVADLVITVEVANLAKNHMPTIRFIKENTGPGKRMSRPSDIAKLDLAGIRALINDNGGNVPDNMPGDNIVQQVGNYAAAIKARAEYTYPTVALLAAIRRLSAASISRIDDVEKFVDEQTEFDFRKQNLDTYLRDKNIVLDQETKAGAKLLYRINKYTTNALAGSLLLKEKKHSAMQIYFTGREKLKGLLGPAGVEEKDIHRLYEASKMQYMNVLAKITDFRKEMHRDTPVAIVSHVYSRDEMPDAMAGVPDLEALFGSFDYCECEHCRSLYGPGAYLTDMLRFLKEHIAVDPSRTVKDILFSRRPDLGNIKLNCVNTDTPLPYIDLVCEVLENNLVGNRDFVYQTTLSAKELRAMPENIQAAAYVELADKDFPMNNSFNLWQEEARSYLKFLRAPRYELMEAFQHKVDPAAVSPDHASIAAEYFGFSSKEKDLVINSRPALTDQQRYWSLDVSQTSASVQLLLKRAGLSYSELLELLQAGFVNNASINTSNIVKTGNSCDTGLQSVSNLTSSKFDLMHRFIRLWRKTGWKIWELDLLLRNSKIGNNVLDGVALSQLWLFKQLQEKIKLPVELLLAFYGDVNRDVRMKPGTIDTLIQPLYNSLFQNVAVTNPVDARFKAIGNLNEKLQPVDPAASFNLLTLDPLILLKMNPDGYTPLPTISSALSVSQADLDLLLKRTGVANLSLASLSLLLRYVYLARGMKLKIADLIALLDITGVADPFTDVRTTLRCLEHLTYIKTAGFSLQQLDYILNYRPDSSAGLRDDSITQSLAGLKKIQDDSGLVISYLQRILSVDTGTFAAFVDVDEWLNALSPLQNILLVSGIELTGDEISAMELKTISGLERGKLTSPDEAANKAALIAAIGKLQTAAATRLDEAVVQKKNQVKAHIASSFGLDMEHADILLRRLGFSGTALSLLDKLENEPLDTDDGMGGEKELDRLNFADHFAIYTLLHKASLLVAVMKIRPDDLDYFIDHSVRLKTPDFAILPVRSTAGNQFTEWLNLCLFLSFKSKFPEPEGISLRTILDLAQDPAATNLQVKTAISKLTMWDDGDPMVNGLSAVETALGIRHDATSRDYLNAELYHRLLKCFELLGRTGTDAASVISWIAFGNDINRDIMIAQQTRQAVKARYEQDDWLNKITPLHDDIREKKRKALVDYHIDYSQRTTGPLSFGIGSIPNPKWEDSNALFRFFLIDVEMSSCQKTSRIKQAISSVQMFVQRCFLNLENNLVIVSQDEKEDVSSPNAWSQWKWMKNYRIWEANRKIFFYPENWLEPELRDDKSPFFKELENELMQGEVTKENAEQAFLNYLHKMDEVSNLEVCGLYHQMEDLNPDEAGYETNIVHIIGRTKSVPAIYYYRTYDMNYSTWKAWEKVDVDITGDHLVPVVYNRKLHLFWLQFMEKPMKTQKVPAAKLTNGPTDAPEPMKVLEVQLGWTIKKPEGWSSKKISKQKLIHPWERPLHSYHLKPYYHSRNNELYLDIYLSTSKEFNNAKFYDPHKELNPSGMTGSGSARRYSEFARNPTYLTKNRFNESFLPWHSSAFVFNGEIRSVELKGLKGQYYLPGNNSPSDMDSFMFVNAGFGEPGSKIEALQPVEFGPRLRLPGGMHFSNNILTNNKRNSANPSELRVLEDANTTTLLRNAIGSFELVITHQDLQLNTMASDHPVFYQDVQKAFFIKPEWQSRLNSYGQVVGRNRQYRFYPFYHPYTTLFIREFNRSGLDGLLNRNIQVKPQEYSPRNNFQFNNYRPTNSVIPDPTVENDRIDFSFGGAYAIYNWELFFHAPLMIACRLMQNQKFEDAMTWFHYIFNPTNIDGGVTPQRYWITRPFFEYNSDAYRRQRIESVLSGIGLNDNNDQLRAWRNNPFNPHIIARYRPVAYQKNVVMKYLDNLIGWADMLFKRDTIEAINEASLLYVLAYDILGRRPQKVPAVKQEELTFNEMESRLDAFGNIRVDEAVEDTLLPITSVPVNSLSAPVPKLEIFYFCIPYNDQITKYWDTIEDRLYKIRHCMNISGVVRQLPLFEDAINPMLLVKAAAAGIDIGSVLNDISSPTPAYRFRVVVQKAIDFCNEVKLLGDKLLSVLEKRDAEQLSLLRSHHEIQVMQAVKEVRKKQIDEAEETIEGLNKSKESAEKRKSYYDDLPRMNELEIAGVALHGAAIASEITSTVLNTAAAGAHLAPKVSAGTAGAGGSPTLTAEMGGENIGNSSAQYAALFQGLGTILHSSGNLIEGQASYTRRDEENKFQSSLAQTDIDQIQYQIDAAMIRQVIAEKELENQEMQIENAKAVDEYMKNKYTNEQLYNWMITETSSLYFQSYQLAYDMARKAEKCYQFELGLPDSNIIRFGYWDSLKKGLLAGDKLMNDLRKLEAGYLDQNKRENEITKQISLSQLGPLALITLRETGVCILSLPEWIFDMDYPGHYMRRIKNVSISIPCIVGPFTAVNCTLSLLRNETRVDATLIDGTYAKTDPEDTRFRTMFGAISSIATSHAQNDSGMFELNFNDERYLPFEGAGVISEWEISLPKENNYFDFASLSDVILQISYTSRSAGGQLATEANADVQARLPDSTARLFSLRHDFSTEWHRFLNPTGGAEQEFLIDLKPAHFPFFIRGRLNTLQIKRAEIFVESSDPAAPGYIGTLRITNSGPLNDVAIDADANFSEVPHAAFDLTAKPLGTVSVKIRTGAAADFSSLTRDQIDDIFILFKLGR